MFLAIQTQFNPVGTQTNCHDQLWRASRHMCHNPCYYPIYTECSRFRSSQSIFYSRGDVSGLGARIQAREVHPAPAICHKIARNDLVLYRAVASSFHPVWRHSVLPLFRHKQVGVKPQRNTEVKSHWCGATPRRTPCGADSDRTRPGL